MLRRIFVLFFIAALFAQLFGATVSAEGILLKEGDRGDEVKLLQTLLIKKGCLDGEADGIFGAATTAAVEKFQKLVNIKADGICGEETFAKLKEKTKTPPAGAPPKGEYAPVGSVIKPGMYGDGVRAVQEILIEKGYLNGDADGICGSRTVHAIRGFQSDAGLTVDGIVGAATYDALHGRTLATDSHGGRVVYVRATAYSAFDPGNSGRTATGKILQRGIIAVDPSFIPLGTRVYIPGYGEATADDIGGNIKGNRIDVAFDTYEEAIAYGVQDVELYIMD